jgi:chromosome segregation ATPase
MEIEEDHAPGAIVKIRVKNFVTYTSAIFNCAPSLNMIIGPNGTGKSTLVCAICLGLGWPPSCLGRAKELGEFVKHGCREAEIEIELAAEKGRNPTIRRTIKREGNKSTWHLNGSATSLKDIQALTKKFHIQIDNLCQFLPQDRVVEFAGMSPEQLLVKTQEAVASEEMVEMHQTLKKAATERRLRSADEDATASRLTQLRARQNQQQGDVDRLRERQDFIHKRDLFKESRPFFQYQDAKEGHEAAKARTRVAVKELEALRREQGPALDEVKAKEGYLKSILQVVEHRKRRVGIAIKHTDTVSRKIKDAGQRIKGYDNEIETEQRAKQKRSSAIPSLKMDIARLESLRRNAPPEFDVGQMNIMKREKESQIRDIAGKRQEIRERGMQIDQREINPRKDSIKELRQELEQSKTKAGQQIRKLRALSRDSFAALEWLEKHKGSFKDDVFAPPVVSCSVKDSRYANAIESSIQRTDLIAFTVTNRDDFKKLQTALLSSTEGLGLSDIVIKTANLKLSHWQHPVQSDRLQELGLDGYLVDYVEGPETVLSMLCDASRLHQTAITLKQHSEQQYEALVDSPIMRWVAGNQAYTITRRREYGPSATSTSVRELQKAKIWSDASSNVNQQQETQTAINKLLEEIDSFTQQTDRLRSDIRVLDDEEKQVEGEKKEIEKEKAQLQKAKADWEGLPTKIELGKVKLQTAMEAVRQADGIVNDIVKKKEVEALNRAQIAIDHSLAVITLRKSFNDRIEAELWSIEAQSDVVALQDRNNEVQELLQSREAEVKSLSAELNKLRDVAKKLADEVRAWWSGISEADQDVVQQFRHGLEQQGGDEEPSQSRGLSDLEAEIASLEGRIALVQASNPRLLQEYEKRGQDIEGLEWKLNKIKSDITDLDNAITRTRQVWEPELDRLVSTISESFAYHFSQIGCAGHVGIRKDEEDFDNWAIEIQVKFRENESLSILDSHRQSGGERAVSTIFYLMALQSLARSPFRVVDEINQGMDPRNERLVHERMVNIACAENTSQYFLVTPKLLSNLEYHPRMAVHVIYSGSRMPEEGSEKLDFAKLADKALMIAGRAGA